MRNAMKLAHPVNMEEMNKIIIVLHVKLAFIQSLKTITIKIA